MKFEFSPHVAFKVKNYNEAVKFYEDVLGMEVINKKDTETHFKKGDINFYVENDDKSPGITFFEFKVDDVQKSKEHLESNGCIVTQVYSDKSLMITDPFGFRFHIWQD